MVYLSGINIIIIIMGVLDLLFSKQNVKIKLLNQFGLF